MSKIPLTIDPDYCADWGVWEGIRELVSNAKDAEDLDSDNKMEIQHLPRTSRLVIRSLHTVVDVSALLVLGKSSKRGQGVRGRFGEGFAIACLALTRARHDVTFINGSDSWRCAIEHADKDHPLEGSQLLTFYSRKVTPVEDFEVRIEGITKEIWDATKELFLFLSPPLARDRMGLKKGAMLLAEERKGQVFSRGVFVRHFDNLQCGYDLNDLNLDRDRRMVNEWELHGQLAELWVSAMKERPDEMAKPLYNLAKNEEAQEAYHLRWKTDDRMLKAMKDEFTAEHGEDAIPVGNVSEARDIKALGAKPTVVNSTLREILEKAGLSTVKAKEALEGSVNRRLGLEELTPEEQNTLSHVELLSPSFVVVDFRGQKTWTKPLDSDAVLGIDRRLLALPLQQILAQVANGEGRRRRVEASHVLIEALQKLLAPQELPVDITCDECGATMTLGEASMVNTTHEESCSLYPSDDDKKEIPF